MKIYILTMGTRGDVQPYIALGLGLKSVGHEVKIATLGEFGSWIREYGLQHQALRGDFLKAAATADEKSARKGRANPFRMIRQYTEMARDTLADEWASARDAGVFIYNPAAIGASDIAEKLGVPTFAAFPAPLYSPTREFPSPFFPIKDLGPLNKLSHKLFAKLGPALFSRPVREWRRKVLGLPPARNGKMLGGQPITHLYAYSEAVVPRPADWDTSAIITGYWFLDASLNWQPDPELVKFINDGQPPVYAGFGSMAMFGGIDKTNLVLEALELAGQRCILAGNGKLTKGKIADGVFVSDTIPHDWLFPQMAAVIHHGGAGTTGASLRAGKPTVICPFVGDQTFWGRRVAVLGAGPALIPFKKLTARNLADAIHLAIDDPAIRRRADAMGKTLRSENGVARAVEIIQQRLDQDGPVVIG